MLDIHTYIYVYFIYIWREKENVRVCLEAALLIEELDYRCAMVGFSSQRHSLSIARNKEKG